MSRVAFFAAMVLVVSCDRAEEESTRKPLDKSAPLVLGGAVEGITYQPVWEDRLEDRRWYLIDLACSHKSVEICVFADGQRSRCTPVEGATPAFCAKWRTHHSGTGTTGAP